MFAMSCVITFKSFGDALSLLKAPMVATTRGIEGLGVAFWYICRIEEGVAFVLLEDNVEVLVS